MRRPTKMRTHYDHLEHVEWPKDLLGPHYMRPDPTLLRDLPDLPKEIREDVDRVTESNIRFYQKVKNQPAPMIRGDTYDPDAIHALKIAIDRLDELERITPPNERATKSLMMWLRLRKTCLVKSMHAVVVAEKGEMYDEANKEPWEVKFWGMPYEHVDQLRFIFRTVMARIDFVPRLESIYEKEKIQPTNHEAIIEMKENLEVDSPAAPCGSFWKIDDSLIENSTLKMRQAMLALCQHGRVLGATWLVWRNTKKNFSINLNIIIRAMCLTIRGIDLVWVERQQNMPKIEEERLLVRLRKWKDAVAQLRITLIVLQLSAEYDNRTVKIDNSGWIFVNEEGEFLVNHRCLFEWDGSL